MHIQMSVMVHLYLLRSLKHEVQNSTSGFVLIVYCNVTNYHQLRGLKQHKIILSQFLWLRSLAQCHFPWTFHVASSLAANPVFHTHL